ncbi:hypothetical protein OAG07_02800 [Verrucomicrobia bacterium]|nr:hypothetical protein [Verrucomicrobiota bacterium]MDB4718043.1 hypothetical protein [Verrucomicrobiota bacterium]
MEAPSESVHNNHFPKFVAGMAVVMILVMLWSWYGREKTSLPEALRSELTSRDGLLFQELGTQPFTGFMIESYKDGILKSRSQVVEGLLHGVSDGYHPNGQLQVREHFEKNISHGLRTKWFASGIKMSEATVVEGQMDGTFQRWDETGTLVEQIALRAGKAHGFSRAFYPSGYLKAQASMQDGEVINQQSWQDNEMKVAGLPTSDTP